MNPGSRKAELYRLVDALPEEKAEAAERLLELLLGTTDEILPENLVEKLDLLERIIDSTPDATLAVDREGKVLVWNRSMEGMTGVKNEEILGRGKYAYAVPFYRKERPILVNILLGNGREWEREYDKIERKGRFSSAKVLLPLRAAAGGFTSGLLRHRFTMGRATSSGRSTSGTSANAGRWKRN